MRNVLGLPLDLARELLMKENVVVSAEETHSKKGVEGAVESRVIRQECKDETHAKLIYARFRTKPNEANA